MCIKNRELIVKFPNDWDSFNNIAPIRQELTDYEDLDPLSYDTVIFDLEKTNSISSVGIGIILSKWRFYKKKKKELILINVNKNIRHTLKLLKIENFFTIK